MGIIHSSVDLSADYANEQIVRPSNWKDSHNTNAFLISYISSNVGMVWTNMPAALTNIFGDAYLPLFPADLTYYDQIMLVGNVVVKGASGATIRIQYSLDAGATWAYPTVDPNQPQLSIAAVGSFSSAWLDLATAAKTNHRMRWVGVGGSGTISPKLGNFYLYAR